VCEQAPTKEAFSVLPATPDARTEQANQQPPKQPSAAAAAVAAAAAAVAAAAAAHLESIHEVEEVAAAHQHRRDVVKHDAAILGAAANLPVMGLL
jgi:hypothetical protein